MNIKKFIKNIPILNKIARFSYRLIKSPKATLITLFKKDIKIKYKDYNLKILLKSPTDFKYAKILPLDDFPSLQDIDELITDKDVVYDIGAFIGTQTIAFAKKAKEVHSFEPYIKNYNRLVENIDHNTLSNITTNKLAVGKNNTIGNLFFKGTGSYSEASLLNTEKITKTYQKIEIINLDTYSKINSLPTVLKIDTEGFEHKVLQGAQKILKNTRIIFLELHLHPITTKIQQLTFEILRKNNFKIKITGGTNHIIRIIAYKQKVKI